jgi:hypothetical protein
MMQITHAAHFKTEGAPKTVASFMNFFDVPGPQTEEEYYLAIDSEVFGL